MEGVQRRASVREYKSMQAHARGGAHAQMNREFSETVQDLESDMVRLQHSLGARNSVVPISAHLGGGGGLQRTATGAAVGFAVLGGAGELIAAAHDDVIGGAHTHEMIGGVSHHTQEMIDGVSERLSLAVASYQAKLAGVFSLSKHRHTRKSAWVVSGRRGERVRARENVWTGRGG